ncbi:MAG: two-component system sensor histidine kinase PilS (NtrC family) [Candidatus Azotimanducaceae bacterium]|jgi:two-component system sensor histidine kinase PilS (NtrC family)
MGSDTFEDLHSLQRSTILRVYNYYRLLISFLFLYLFSVEDFSEFVGAAQPELFQDTIIVYLLANVLLSLSPIVVSEQVMAKTAPSFTILIVDIIALTLLMSASGGVSSGLGNFLIFTVAFGGTLVYGKISTVLPAVAFILTLYNEIYFFFLDQNDAQSFFQAGILGIVYFVANIFFQSLSQQLRKRETEVFALEEINQTIVEKMRTGVAIADAEGNIKLINAAGKLLLNSSNPSPEAMSILPTNLLKEFRDGKLNHNKKSITFHTTANSPELLASFSEINSSENDSDTLIFIEDNTEVQRQAQQLKLAALGRLSASIAHEIRNPLGAISHAAQLLAESEHLDTGDKRLSDIIQNHCVRMNNVIENVLQMSRRRTAEPRPLNLHKWLPQFVTEFSVGLQEESEIIIDSNDIPEEELLNFDPLHLSQILGNLSQNGLRYSKKNINESKVKIIAGINAVSNTAFIEVVDWGAGVKEDLVQNLFEPFYTTETQGTGLGLYLSKELCEANHARLSYSIAANGGSCFRISFIQQVRQ